MSDYRDRAERYQDLIERSLRDNLPRGRLECAGALNDAISYAVFPGGKRFRPFLTLLGSDIVNGPAEQALPAACAIEYLHTASLIFDDLPAMDDADVRRSRETVHVRFGEDLALLAALALLNRAYGLFGRHPALIAEAAHCIGENGMIGGQAVDLALRSDDGAAAVGLSARNRKTSALVRLTLSAGALACGADRDDVAALARCGELVGAAYQVCDDLLDENLAAGETGKTARQDARHLRASASASWGARGCRDYVQSLLDEARTILLDRFGPSEPVRVLTLSVETLIRSFDRAMLVTA